MIVGFNARLLASPDLRGWNRYTTNLLAALPAQGVQLVLYSDRPLHESHLARLPAGSFETRVAPRMRYSVWEQHWLPRQCRRDRIDVLHTPFHFGLPWRSPCPRVLTLHDAIDQAYYAKRTPSRARWTPSALRDRWYQWSARVCAERIITVSTHAKGDLVSVLGLPESKITIIPEAADPRFHAPIASEDRVRVRERYGLTQLYVFYVGGWEERKNLPFLIRAFGAAGIHGVELVLAGGRDDQRAALDALAAEYGMAARVRLLGWVEDADLPALYAEALCYVNPSEYEGFGLQLCEAMAVGCPTLAARATSLPEVLGSGGETFDLTNTDALMELLRRVAKDSSYRAELAQRARERSHDFSWSRTAERTAAVYRELLPS